MEQTLSIIKPNAVKSMGSIIQMIQLLESVEIKEIRMVKITTEQATELYKEHKEREDFDKLITFITSAPVVAMVLEGPGIIKRHRELMIEEDSNGSCFSPPYHANAIHGSNSVENAKREIAIFFTNFLPICCCAENVFFDEIYDQIISIVQNRTEPHIRKKSNGTLLKREIRKITTTATNDKWLGLDPSVKRGWGLIFPLVDELIDIFIYEVRNAMRDLEQKMIVALNGEEDSDEDVPIGFVLKHDSHKEFPVTDDRPEFVKTLIYGKDELRKLWMEDIKNNENLEDEDGSY